MPEMNLSGLLYSLDEDTRPAFIPVPLTRVETRVRVVNFISEVGTRVVNRIFFHFPVSEGYNRVDNRIANIVKIIG